MKVTGGRWQVTGNKDGAPMRADNIPCNLHPATCNLFPGQKVIVHFARPDGKLQKISGKFSEYMNIGVIGVQYGLVKFSKSGSVLVPVEDIEVV
jgi:hypothetical protein